MLSEKEQGSEITNICYIVRKEEKTLVCAYICTKAK